MVCNLAATSLLLCLVLAAPTDDSELSFNDEAARAKFDEGKKLFEAGDWKDADACFRECATATDRDGKKVIQSWRKACKGGPNLVKVEGLILEKKWKSALKKVNSLESKYASTPLRDRMERAMAEIEKIHYEVVATFEETKNAPGSHAWRVNEDPRFVKRGSRSLEFKATDKRRSATLALVGADLLTKSRRVEFWVHPAGQKHEVIFMMAGSKRFEIVGDPDHGAVRFTGSCLYNRMTLSGKGWLHVRLDLSKDLTSNEGATLADMSRLMLFHMEKDKAIYIDHVRLLKK